MGYPVPKDLKGEERLFVIPGINVPINKKSILYNGPASLLAVAVGKIANNVIVFLAVFIILNIIAFPFGNTKNSKRKFDNGYMDNDKLFKQKFLWKLRGGGNIYISHKRGSEE